MKVTTEIKARRFKDYEKDYLFRKLQEPAKIKYEEFKKKNDEFFEKILKDILDPDMLYLGSRKYCASTGRFEVVSTELGLPDLYCGIKDGPKTKISKVFNNLGLAYPISTKSSSFSSSINVTRDIKEKCSEDILEQVKSNLMELAKLDYEYQYFGVGTIRDTRSYYYSYLFVGINTWGQLLAKYPDYFEVLYKHYQGEYEDKDEKTKEDVNSVEYMMKDMKRHLGY
jgi:hypothetical protein